MNEPRVQECFTPKGSHSIAQGRAAHPGKSDSGGVVYPEGVAQGGDPAFVQPLRGTLQPSAIETQGALRDPGLLSVTPSGWAATQISFFSGGRTGAAGGDRYGSSERKKFAGALAWLWCSAL